MSWKIYNGFKMNYISTFEFYMFNQELKERIKEISKEKYFEYVVNLTLSMKNKLCLLDEEFKNTKNSQKIENYLTKLFYTSFVPTSVILSDVILAGKEYKYSYKDIVDKLNTHFGKISEITFNKISNVAQFSEISLRRVPFDFTASLCMYPMEDESKILLLPYGIANELIEVLLNSKDEQDIAFVKKYGLESYYYQNSTDDDLEEKDFKQREKDWRLVFEKVSTPFEACMTILLVDIDLFFTDLYLLQTPIQLATCPIAKYIEKIDFEEICRKKAIDKVKEDYVCKEKEKNGEDFSLYSTLINFNEKINNKDQEIEKNILNQELFYKNILSPLTLEDFYKTPIDFLNNYKIELKIK